MRRTLIAALVSITLAAGLPAAVSAAGGSPVDDGGHCHYVVTKHDRVVIDAVRWLPVDHGLHQGASMSGEGQGPEHTSCL